MATRNYNIRFRENSPKEQQAWEILHGTDIETAFKSRNAFLVEAINEYYARWKKREDDPYLETREQEMAFVDRIVAGVEAKFLQNLPALLGTWMMQGGGAGYCGTAPGGVIREGDASIIASKENRSEQELDTGERTEEPPDNDLLDFDAF